MIDMCCDGRSAIGNRAGCGLRRDLLESPEESRIGAGRNNHGLGRILCAVKEFPDKFQDQTVEFTIFNRFHADNLIFFLLHRMDLFGGIFFDFTDMQFRSLIHRDQVTYFFLGSCFKRRATGMIAAFATEPDIVEEPGIVIENIV
jgi:hypothetical protein